MKLKDISNHRQNVLARFDEFASCYQGADLLAITALRDKMEHMCFYIGSPASLPDMLKSIINGKIKFWSEGRSKIDHGTQLRGQHVAQMTRQNGEFKYNNRTADDYSMTMTNCGYLKGHFRWNYTGYMLSREARDYINDFWFNPDFIPVKRDSRLNGFVHISYKAMPYTEDYPSYNILVIETKWHRWSYKKYSTIVNAEVFHTNIGNGSVRPNEMVELRNIANRTTLTR
tara:strand:- start:1571 stop:2257 length:687 start_codon:yes stop_codon:yes gene_type:complete